VCAELARTNVGRGPKVDRMPTERRVADLAADGLSDQDIAEATHICVTTVEANLSRVYRKVGAPSRVEHGRRMDQRPPSDAAP